MMPAEPVGMMHGAWHEGRPARQRRLAAAKGIDRRVMHTTVYNAFNLQRRLISHRTLRTFRVKATNDSTQW
jgi:hypothetical protein